MTLWDALGKLWGLPDDDDDDDDDDDGDDDDDDDDLHLSLLYIQTPDQPPTRPLC